MTTASPNPYAPPTAPLAEQVDAGPQAIWNPNAAANWSLLLSPAFGTTIQMLNWRALGEPERAATAKGWVVASFILLALSLAPIQSEEVDRLLRFVNLAYLLGWYFSTGRAQVRYVKARFGASYPKKPWGKPLLLAFGGLLALVALSVGLSFLVAPS